MIKDQAKTIVCFGDSNTWGAIPRSDKRYPRSERWTNILQQNLGDSYEVINEGLPSRTIVVTDSVRPHKVGITHIRSIIETHYPVDLLIIMLGTNDFQSKYALKPEDIAEHLEKMIQFIKNFDLQKLPKILVLCPPSIVQPEKLPVSKVGKDLDKEMRRGIDYFKYLPDLFKKIAEDNNVDFINTGDYISSSRLDGFHLDTETEVKLANLLKTYIVKTTL